MWRRGLGDACRLHGLAHAPLQILRIGMVAPLAPGSRIDAELVRRKHLLPTPVACGFRIFARQRKWQEYLANPALNPVHLGSSNEVGPVSWVALALSAAIFPWIAGYRLAKRRSSVIVSAIGGASISVATVATVAIIYAATNTQLESFLGFVIATAALAVVPQLIFGALANAWAWRNGVEDI